MVEPLLRRLVVILGARGFGGVIALADLFIHYGFQKVVALVDNLEKYDIGDRKWLKVETLSLNKLQDPNQLAIAVKSLGVSKENKDVGYICIYDPLIIPYVLSRKILGLQDNILNWKVPSQALLNSRIKPRARELLNKAGLQTSWTILSEEEAKNIKWQKLSNFEPSENSTYFVKPITGDQSKYVRCIRGWTEAKKVAQEIRDKLQKKNPPNSHNKITIVDENDLQERIYSQSSDILIEEELIGQEYSIDGFIQNGEVCFAVQHKEIRYQFPFHGDFLTLSPPDDNINASLKILKNKIENENVIVSKPCNISRNEFKKFIERTLNALKMDNWVFHAEVMATSSGLHLIELNPRFPGALLTQTAGLHLGIDLIEVLVRLYLGIPSITNGRFNCITGHLMLHADPNMGIAQDIEGINEILEIPEIIQIKKVGMGNIINERNQENYACLVTICANSHEKVRNIAQKVISKLKIIYS